MYAAKMCYKKTYTINSYLQTLLLFIKNTNCIAYLTQVIKATSYG